MLTLTHASIHAHPSGPLNFQILYEPGGPFRMLRTSRIENSAHWLETRNSCIVGIALKDTQINTQKTTFFSYKGRIFPQMKSIHIFQERSTRLHGMIMLPKTLFLHLQPNWCWYCPTRAPTLDFVLWHKGEHKHILARSNSVSCFQQWPANCLQELHQWDLKATIFPTIWSVYMIILK